MAIRRYLASLVSVLLLAGLSDVGQAADSTSDGCGWQDGALTHGRRDLAMVALSFDACPTTHQPSFSDGILSVLSRESVPATVFVSGLWATENAAPLRRLLSTPGIEIALHGDRHRHLLERSAAVTDTEINVGRETLRRMGARPVALFRPPFGDAPRWLAARAGKAGVTPVLWEVVSGDPDPRFSARLIERIVLQEAKPGSIVIMHINGRGEHTAQALPGVITGLRARGLQLVTVGQLLRECGR